MILKLHSNYINGLANPLKILVKIIRHISHTGLRFSYKCNEQMYLGLDHRDQGCDFAGAGSNWLSQPRELIYASNYSPRSVD